MAKIAVFIINDNNLRGIEGEKAERVCKYLLSDNKNDDIVIYEIEKNNKITIGDFNRVNDFSFLVLIKGLLYITREGIGVLSDIASRRKDISFLAPVSNESTVDEQRQSPPFMYQTITVFKWATEEIYKEFKDTVIESKRLDNFCIAFRRDMINDLPNDFHVKDLHNLIQNNKYKLGIAKGVYVHRYGNVYESSREDLLAYIPIDAKKILDIGCAKGLFGEILKKRQNCIVTGVDINPENISIAQSRLNTVICSDIETVISKGELGLYDCIVCGDILEHLIDPWAVVRGLKKHLRTGGLFIASTPNINNWAIIYDMLKGRWDYVPFSILSGTHLRFFTKQTFLELFLIAHYKILDIHFQKLGVPDKGKTFIENIKQCTDEISLDELEGSEIVIVAKNI